MKSSYKKLAELYKDEKIKREEAEKKRDEYKIELEKQKQLSNITVINKNMTQKRNILLLGRTGNGKSTLANVISATENFRESAGSVSQTKDAQVEEFVHDGINYRIIDTIGIGDTSLTEDEYFAKISEVASEIKDGINQILFVVKGRFTEEETKAYGKLILTAFDNEVVKYTTIVRVNFPEFTNKEKIKEDRQNLLNEKKDIKDIIEEINFLYVDNPPVDISGDGKRIKLQIEANKLARGDSREIIMNFLETQRGTYKPTNLEKLNEKLKGCASEEEKVEVTKRHAKENLYDLMTGLADNCIKAVNTGVEKGGEATEINLLNIGDTRIVVPGSSIPGKIAGGLLGVGFAGTGLAIGTAVISGKLISETVGSFFSSLFRR